MTTVETMTTTTEYVVEVSKGVATISEVRKTVATETVELPPEMIAMSEDEARALIEKVIDCRAVSASPALIRAIANAMWELSTSPRSMPR